MKTKTLIDKISDVTEKLCVIFLVIFIWLNANHFDYRGLIEKGLALEATEGMYNV